MGNQANTTIDFGATMTGDTKVKTITGEAGILAASAVEAWLRCEDSADHTKDEHFIENIDIRAGNIVAGTGFDIFGEAKIGTLYGIWNVSWVWN